MSRNSKPLVSSPSKSTSNDHRQTPRTEDQAPRGVTVKASDGRAEPLWVSLAWLLLPLAAAAAFGWWAG
jgi:hypothetical protein